MCVSALIYVKHDISKRLIEWLELLRLQDIEHAYVYYYSLHLQVWKTLRYYVDVGFVTLLPFTMPG